MRFAPQHLRTFMVTFSTSERKRLFQAEQNALLMQATLETYRAQGRYDLHARVPQVPLLGPGFSACHLTPTPPTPSPNHQTSRPCYPHPA